MLETLDSRLAKVEQAQIRSYDSHFNDFWLETKGGPPLVSDSVKRVVRHSTLMPRLPRMKMPRW